jgi:hypothetical protein
LLSIQMNTARCGDYSPDGTDTAGTNWWWPCDAVSHARSGSPVISAGVPGMRNFG